jgi:MFS family permease
MEETTPKKQSWIRRHYHWVIFAAVFLENLLYTGVANNCYTLFLRPITTDLGIPRSTFALYSTFAMLPGFCSNLIFSRFYKRIGYKKLVTVLLLLFALMMVCYSRAQGVVPFYIGAASFAFAAAFIGTAGISRLMTDWFHKHRGLLLGIILAASGIGPSLGSMVLTAIMERYSWRTAYLAAAGVVLMGAALVFLLVRDTPQEMGLQPFGEQETPQPAEGQGQKIRALQGMQLSALKKRPHFYIMVASILLSCVATYVVYPTLVSHMQDLGMPMVKAAQIQSYMFLFLAGAKILEGILSDRFGAKRVMVLCFGCCIVSNVILAQAASYAVAVLGVAIFSLALAESTIMLPILVEDVYGTLDRSAILGIFLAFARLSTGIGPTLGNIAYDAMGSYTAIYYIMAAVALGALGLFGISVRAVEREKKRTRLSAAEL